MDIQKLCLFLSTKLSLVEACVREQKTIFSLDIATSCFWDSPENHKDQRNDPEYTLIHPEFRFCQSRRIFTSYVSLADPPKLRADQKHKTNQESSDKASEMSKVVNIWKDSYCQINDNYK